MKTDRPTILLAAILLVLCLWTYLLWPVARFVTTTAIPLMRQGIAQEAAKKAGAEFEASERLRRYSQDIIGGKYEGGSPRTREDD